MVEDIHAASGAGASDILHEQVQLAVIVVINPKRALPVITPRFDSRGVADVVKGPISLTFVKQIACRSLLGPALKRGFGNEEIEVAIPIVISKGEAEPIPSIW